MIQEIRSKIQEVQKKGNWIFKTKSLHTSRRLPQMGPRKPRPNQARPVDTTPKYHCVGVEELDYRRKHRCRTLQMAHSKIPRWKMV